MKVDKINALDQKRITKAWGKGGITVRNEADLVLSKHGFVADPLGSEARYVTWSKSLGSGISHAIDFDCFEDKGRRYFRSGLSVYSDQVHSMLEKIKYWECSADLPIQPPSKTCVLFAGDVEWWAEYSENKEMLLNERRYRAWFVAENTSQEVLVWGQTFEQYGVPLLAALDTPEEVVDFLQHLERYPKSMGGPVSANREIYTALLLHSLGRTAEALKELEIKEAHLKALLARDEYYRRGYEVGVSNIKKIRELFAG